MKIATNILSALLGIFFVFSAVVVLFKLVDMPPIPENTLPGKFMGALGPSGYMTMVKVFELIGGVLIAIPKTRNFGLLVLGPIIINIIAFHFFIGDRKELLSPPMIGIVAITLFLLWTERKAFAGLLR
jgi:putative oxidoreductase